MNYAESKEVLQYAVKRGLPFESREYEALAVVIDAAHKINELPLFDRLLGVNESVDAFNFMDKLIDWASVNFYMFSIPLPTKGSITQYDDFAIGPDHLGYGSTVMIRGLVWPPSALRLRDRAMEWVRENNLYRIGVISHGKLYIHAEWDDTIPTPTFYEIYSAPTDTLLMDFKLRFC